MGKAQNDVNFLRRVVNIFNSCKIFGLFVSFLIFNGLYSYIPSSISMFEHSSRQEFEPLSDGSDSYVLKICGMKQFNSEVLNCKNAVVVKFFRRDSTIIDRVRRSYQELAKNLKGNIKFVSVDIEENKDLLQQFSMSFLTLITKDPNLEKANPKLYNHLVKIFKYMIVAQKDELDVIPFVFFFKDSNMIIPKRFNFEKKRALQEDIEEQLLGEEEKNTTSICMRDGRFLKINNKFFALKEEQNTFWKKLEKTGKRIKNWFAKL